MPPLMKINNNYVFQARAASMGTLFVKQYSDCSSWVAISYSPRWLNRRTCYATNVRCLHRQLQVVDKPLHTVQATAKKTRRQYLVDEVCNRYHDGDEDYKARYSSSWSTRKSLWVSWFLWCLRAWEVDFKSLPVFQQLCIWLTVPQLCAANICHDSGQLCVLPCWRHDRKYSLTLQLWRPTVVCNGIGKSTTSLFILDRTIFLVQQLFFADISFSAFGRCTIFVFQGDIYVKNPLDNSNCDHSETKVDNLQM